MATKKPVKKAQKASAKKPVKKAAAKKPAAKKPVKKSPAKPARPAAKPVKKAAKAPAAKKPAVKTKKAASPVKAVKKAVAKKVVVKPAAKKPAAKPVAAKPVAKNHVKPAAKPVVTPAAKTTVAKPVAKSAKPAPVKPEVKTAKPVIVKNEKPLAQPLPKVKPETKEKPVAKTTPVAPPAKPTPEPQSIAKKPMTNVQSNEKTRYSDAELKEFKELIMRKLEDARAELINLQAQIINANENGTDDTSATFKMLEDGSDTLAKEEAAQLAARQKKFIEQLDAALVRIENKTYGVCRVTGKLIPKERLRAVPHTTQSMEAKLQQYRD